MLHLTQSGSGLPILFLHAFPLSHTLWDHQTARLSRNFHCLAVDLPGGGQSPNTSDIVTMDQMATAVLQTLDGHNITSPFVAVGLSMGGYVLCRLIAQAPNRIRAAVFVSTRPGPDTPAAREKRAANIDFINGNGLASFADRMMPALFGKTSLERGHSAVTQVKSDIAAGSAEGFCAQLRGMAIRPDSTSDLLKLKGPVLVISGSEDTVIPVAEMKELASRLKGSEFHEIPEAGHLVNLEKPEIFEDKLLHFLKRRVL